MALVVAAVVEHHLITELWAEVVEHQVAAMLATKQQEATEPQTLAEVVEVLE
jgi:hypothetical protein